MLRIYVGDELLELTDDDLDMMYVDEGKEAVVYKYGDEALKIYKPRCRKIRLDEDTASKYSEITNMKRILLPKRIIRNADEDLFCGYFLPFIYKNLTETIPNITMERFINELDIISDDMRILADNEVEVNDFHMGNLLYNGKFFIGDPGSYTINRSLYTGTIYVNNINVLSKFVQDGIFGMVKLSKKKRNNVYKSFNDWQYIGDQIRKTARPKETVKQYVRRMAR